MEKGIYLSIVLAVRNDDYGGDFICRLQNFINWNTALLEKHQVDTEIILVNWNPILKNKNINELVSWPENRKHVTYRIITVPNDVHEGYANIKKRKVLPLYEYLAKNTGIRRSYGKFVLVTNPDIQINESIVRIFSKKKLRSNVYYRANRLDFKKSINNVKKLWLKGFSYDIKKPPTPLILNLFKLKTSLKSLNYYLIRKLNFLWSTPLHPKAEYKYHCNVSGDFMLMHKDAWVKLKANPENTYLPLHTDALMVVLAATSGLKEKVFNAPIYHQEHQRRFDAKEINNNENRKAYLYFQNESQEMIQNKKPKQYNNKNWGLAKFDLKEEIF